MPVPDKESECVKGTDFASFYDFSNGCWSCSDSGIFCVFHFIFFHQIIYHLHLFCGSVRVALRIDFLCCIVLRCLVGLRPVSCVPKDASASGLSILDFYFGFL
jgi:hypothetical protein